MKWHFAAMRYLLATAALLLLLTPASATSNRHSQEQQAEVAPQAVQAALVSIRYTVKAAGMATSFYENHLEVRKEGKQCTPAHRAAEAAEAAEGQGAREKATRGGRGRCVCVCACVIERQPHADPPLAPRIASNLSRASSSMK